MKVSIIIPVYNVSDYIERCIKSVMNQTYCNIECIIVDDATPDDSMAKCEQMIAAYDGPIQFSVLHHLVNRGLSAARNTGTDAAIGEYIYYLDSDDEITPDCIEKLLQPILENPSLELVQGVHLNECEGNEYIFHKQKRPINISCREEVYKEYYKTQNLWFSAWNKLIKRSLVVQHKIYFTEGIIHEDVLWMFYVLKQLKKAYLRTDVTLIYHIRPNSITTKPRGRLLGSSFQTIYQTVFKNLTPGMESIELKGYLYRFCRLYCLYSDEIPDYKSIMDLYRKQAKRLGCWYVYSILTLVGFMCKFGNPLGGLRVIHLMKWEMAKVPEKLSFVLSK